VEKVGSNEDGGEEAGTREEQTTGHYKVRVRGILPTPSLWQSFKYSFLCVG